MSSVDLLDYEQPPTEGGMTWDEEQQIWPKQESHAQKDTQQTATTTTASSDNNRSAEEDTGVYVDMGVDVSRGFSNQSLEEGEIVEDSQADSTRPTEEGGTQGSSQAGSTHSGRNSGNS
ncbi:hypothetical protein IAR50_005327 [Cryptococcus sp. DSM 104548]